jgi:hypothetical protein
VVPVGLFSSTLSSDSSIPVGARFGAGGF